MARVNAKDWITEDGLTKIQGWARDGLTNDQIAHNIGCNRATLYSWIKRYSDIDNALKRGKEVIDRQVENALLKRALGYQTVESTEERILDDYTGEYKLLETKVVTKQVAPDVTAQIFWLKNRKPAEWRDKRDVEHSGEMTTNVNNMNNLSEEELRKLAKLNSD